jgi:Trypsin
LVGVAVEDVEANPAATDFEKTVALRVRHGVAMNVFYEERPRRTAVSGSTLFTMGRQLVLTSAHNFSSLEERLKTKQNIPAAIRDLLRAYGGAPENPTAVFFGTHPTRDLQPTEYKIVDVIFHPYYVFNLPSNPHNLKFDIAVALLDRPVIDAEPLELSRTIPAPGMLVGVEGYGKTSDIAPASMDLRVAEMEIGTDFYHSTPAQAEYVIVLKGRGEREICKMDSGGAVVNESLEVVGMLTALIRPGDLRCRPDALATRVDAHLAFIEAAVQKLAPGDRVNYHEAPPAEIGR